MRGVPRRDPAEDIAVHRDRPIPTVIILLCLIDNCQTGAIGPMRLAERAMYTPSRSPTATTVPTDRRNLPRSTEAV